MSKWDGGFSWVYGKKSIEVWDPSKSLLQLLWLWRCARRLAKLDDGGDRLMGGRQMPSSQLSFSSSSTSLTGFKLSSSPTKNRGTSGWRSDMARCCCIIRLIEMAASANDSKSLVLLCLEKSTTDGEYKLGFGQIVWKETVSLPNLFSKLTLFSIRTSCQTNTGRILSLIHTGLNNSLCWEAFLPEEKSGGQERGSCRGAGHPWVTQDISGWISHGRITN